MAYYVFDDAKNLFEGMTKEQIVNAIASATGLTPEQIDADVITSAIKEQNAQKSVNLWIGTQNEYNAIAAPDENTLYVVTDPHETNELQSQINQLQSEVDNIVAASTTNATGFVIQKLESDPLPLEYNSTYQYYAATNLFTVPEGSVILEASWRRSINNDKNIDDLAVVRESETVVRMRHYTETQEVSATFILTLVISYPQPITLPELTDIRVGYDGTVYGSAGEAVRRQIFKVGFNDYVKSALLNLLSKVAYIDGNGQQYYNALERAMYMLAGVTSITAVFDQGENVVYDTDDLDTLRQYLTVTAYYEDNTREIITDYTLNGTLEAGTSTVAVSYGGKTTSFNVSVTADPLDEVVFNGATYRQLFEGEYTVSAKNFDTGSILPAIVSDGTPTVTTEQYSTKNCSLKCFGTSNQLIKHTSVTDLVGHKYIGLVRIKCDRYSAGRIGVLWGATNHGLQRTTTEDEGGWYTYSFLSYLASTTPTTRDVYIGSYAAANLDGYVDDFMYVDVTDINDIDWTNTEQRTALRTELRGIFEQYIQIKNAR